MLRMLFGEPPRQSGGELLRTIQAMEQFASMLHKQIAQRGDTDHRLKKYRIWTMGLLAALDELEQSQYAALKFAEKVKSECVEDMSAEELLHYHRHVYFDKNAFIRLFAVLDKLGTLMNEFLGLETERLKTHFSYFTVLRVMKQRNLYPELSSALSELKEKYKDPLARLRKRRNTEIHYMNSEMQDDLLQSHQVNGGRYRLENLNERLGDLEQAMEIVYKTLQLTFNHACAQMRKRR
ncbi:hypothetical protein KZ483_22365 [Paenibacillus sp. sptzw28]|uniref:Cthe_2314 family HEPN domain-containing protein n=1 Tax=Paenibacillus sp. sptzw28 TaxID=715179 RepID=UPI001C6E2FFF|nr:Cthe_2314 family HEPN domain-containing protein [Paenibacillus sp. sptzw28]QYR20519.1 hypothetical protein KZ483_22365 [Paenibacillus sp. sptzw28]